MISIQRSLKIPLKESQMKGQFLHATITTVEIRARRVNKNPPEGAASLRLGRKLFQ